jgi:hypothetical protein
LKTGCGTGRRRSGSETSGRRGLPPATACDPEPPELIGVRSANLDAMCGSSEITAPAVDGRARKPHAG